MVSLSCLRCKCIPCRNCMGGAQKASILVVIDTILLLSYKLVLRDLQLGKGSYWLSIHCMSCISHSLKTCCWLNASIFSLAFKNNNSDRTFPPFSLFYTEYFTFRDKNKWEWVRCLKVLNQFHTSLKNLNRWKNLNHNKHMTYRVISRVFVGEKLPSPRRNFYHYSI